LVCSLGYLEAARLLLDHGADTEQADEEELTPLHDACREGHLEVARLLLDSGADKDAADNTPRQHHHFCGFSWTTQSQRDFSQEGRVAITAGLPLANTHLEVGVLHACGRMAALVLAESERVAVANASSGWVWAA